MRNLLRKAPERLAEETHLAGAMLNLVPRRPGCHHRESSDEEWRDDVMVPPVVTTQRSRTPGPV
jgi:hypothetical protein